MGASFVVTTPPFFSRKVFAADVPLDTLGIYKPFRDTLIFTELGWTTYYSWMTLTFRCGSELSLGVVGVFNSGGSTFCDDVGFVWFSIFLFFSCWFPLFLLGGFRKRTSFLPIPVVVFKLGTLRSPAYPLNTHPPRSPPPPTHTPPTLFPPRQTHPLFSTPPFSAC